MIQIQTPRGPVCCLELALAEGSTVQDALNQLQITLAPEHLMLVVNRQIVEVNAILHEGDKLDLIPAMSGG